MGLEYENCPYFQTFNNLELKPKDIVELKEDLKIVQTKVNFNLYVQLGSFLALVALMLKVFV